MATPQDYRERQRLDLEAMETIEKVFAGFEFSPEEQRFVEEAGLKLAEYSLDLFVKWPQARELRPMIVMYAMAAILGGNSRLNPGSKEMSPRGTG